MKELSAAFALAVPRTETDEVAPHLAFAQRVVAMIQKRLGDEASGNSHHRQWDVDAAVRQVTGGAVDSKRGHRPVSQRPGSMRRRSTFFPTFCSACRHWQKNLAMETH